MAEFSYLFADLLTNQVNLEVPLYGVSYDRMMNKAGNCTFSLNLDRTDYTNQDVIDATVPGKTAIYMDRNGQLFWGGVVWSRTYQSQAKGFAFTGQTFESFFYKVGIETSLTYTNKDQRSIVCELIQYAQSKNACDIGVIMPLGYPFSGGISRTTSFYTYDLWTVGKALDYMAEYDTGLDFTIEVMYDENGDPAKYLRVDNVLGADADSTGLALDYPGNVSNYWFPENASRSAVSVIGAGAGDGTAKIITVSRNADKIATGFPDLQEIYTNDDVSVMSTLQSQTAREQVRLNPLISVPTIVMHPELEPVLGTWSLGDYANFSIEDPRFESGITIPVRVVGYNGNPPSEESTETCSLVIEGQDDAA